MIYYQKQEKPGGCGQDNIWNDNRETNQNKETKKTVSQ